MNVPAALGVAALVAVTTAAPLGDAEHLTLSIAIGTAADRAAAAGAVTAYETDVRRIARVFDGLGLPLPTRVTVHLYPTPDRFTAGLVHDLGVTRPLATTIGRFAAGAALDDTLLVLEPEFQRGPPAWIRLLAHEMAHLSQIQLAGGRPCGAQWIAEGMADRVAATVLERLGMTPPTPAEQSLVGWTAVPPLEHLAEPRHFLEHSARLGAGPLYRFASVLVDRLVDRHGFAGLVAYFRLCPATDGEAAFVAVFGQRPADLAREIGEELRRAASI